MLVRIIEVTPDGLLLEVQNGASEPRTFWLPNYEWSDSQDEWLQSYDTLICGDTVDVVEIDPAEYDVKLNLPIVSRKRFGLQHIEKSQWIGAERVMTIDEVSKSYIRGTVGSLSAIIPCELYKDYFSSKRLNNRLLEHSILSKGDQLAGLVTRINDPMADLVLDPSQYLDLAARQSGRGIIPLDTFSLGTESQQNGNVNITSELNALSSKITPLLLVENDVACRQTLEALLSSAGVTVVTAESLSEAKKLFSEDTACKDKDVSGDFSFAIIDPNLEFDGRDLGGLEVAHKLSLQPKCRILLMSGEIGNKTKVEKWGTLRIHAYLEKPFSIERLLSAIKECLEINPRTLEQCLESDREFETDIKVEADSLSNPAAMTIFDELNTLLNTKADIAICVFKFHYRSLRPSMLGSVGLGLKWEAFLWKISKSPVKDAAFSSIPIYEPNASRYDQDERGYPKKHFWTRRMLAYESFYGIKLDVIDMHRYSLVVFHKNQDAFDDQFRAKIDFHAERITRIIERELLIKQRESEANLIATGLALECLGHEMYTDLTTLAGQLTLKRQEIGDDSCDNSTSNRVMEEWLGYIYSRVSTLIDMSDALRGVRVKKKEVSVYRCLYDATASARMLSEQYSHPLGAIDIAIPDASLITNWVVKSVPAALRVVFINIYLNAIQQLCMMSPLKRNGKIWHTTELRLDENKREWGLVHIHDNGPGIHGEDFQRLYEPTFTTKESGTGLGLWICRRLLHGISDRKRQASIQVSRSAIWSGTSFTIKLPLLPLKTAQ